MTFSNTNEISQNLGLEKSDELSEDQMIDTITTRVNDLLERDPELLMSYLYRLDILEEKIQAVLNQPSSMPINKGLAKLIWDRQKQRMVTKKKYKQKPIEDWEY